MELCGGWGLAPRYFVTPSPRCADAKNKDLQKGAYGSITICVQADEPNPVARANWRPSPTNVHFSLYVRAYWPDDPITRGQWTPPALVKVQ